MRRCTSLTAHNPRDKIASSTMERTLQLTKEVEHHADVVTKVEVIPQMYTVPNGVEGTRTEFRAVSGTRQPPAFACGVHRSKLRCYRSRAAPQTHTTKDAPLLGGNILVGKSCCIEGDRGLGDGGNSLLNHPKTVTNSPHIAPLNHSLKLHHTTYLLSCGSPCLRVLSTRSSIFAASLHFKQWARGTTTSCAYHALGCAQARANNHADKRKDRLRVAMQLRNYARNCPYLYFCTLLITLTATRYFCSSPPRFTGRIEVGRVLETGVVVHAGCVIVTSVQCATPRSNTVPRTTRSYSRPESAKRGVAVVGARCVMLTGQALAV